MKKIYHPALIVAYILIILAGVMWHAGGVSAEDTIRLTVNAHTTSTAVMNNMQPGDVTASEYTVINEGHDSFNYFVDFSYVSGDMEFYNILQMTLQKEGVTLYSGIMSEAEGRVAIGTLAGGQQDTIEMHVAFPVEAGNEYQGKRVSVAFTFSATGITEPTAVPTATSSPGASPGPSSGPGPTPTAPASPEPSSGASSVPTATAGASTSPGTSATPGITAGPSAAPASEVVETTATDDPVPLGASETGTDPSATPAAATTVTATTVTATPSPDTETVIGDEELPLAGPDGDELPDTAEPWYNLILISLAVAILCIIVMRRLHSKK